MLFVGVQRAPVAQHKIGLRHHPPSIPMTVTGSRAESVPHGRAPHVGPRHQRQSAPAPAPAVISLYHLQTQPLCNDL